MSERILIAGCGFIGRALAERLQAAGHDVIGLTHSAESAAQLREEVPFPVESVDISMCEEVAALADRVPSPSQVVHCASSGRGGSDSYERVYFQGCVNLADTFPAALLLFTSSTSVYPQTDGELLTETNEAEPDRETGKILRRTEEFVLRGGGIVTRLAGLYGPGRSVLLQKFLDGIAVIETGPSRYLNQIHRDDVVSAIELLLAKPESAKGEIFNVADGNQQSLRETYQALAEHFGRPVPPDAPPDLNRKRGWTNKRVSNEKLKKLGWTPAYPSFLDAVREDPHLFQAAHG